MPIVVPVASQFNELHEESIQTGNHVESDNIVNLDGQSMVLPGSGCSNVEL